MINLCKSGEELINQINKIENKEFDSHDRSDMTDLIYGLASNLKKENKRLENIIKMQK